MKYLSKVLIFVVVLAFLMPNVAYAGDYISDAVEALKHTTVYVAPGTEGTDNYTSGKLQNMLRNDDNIVLVMFPAEAKLGTDAYSIVKSLSEKLGNQRTIGLAVGREVVGFGPLLPSGVAADMMKRADSVSNDPVTALATFAQNMHIWLAAHPQATATPRPTTTPSQDKQFPWFVIVLVAVGVIIVAFVVITMRRKGEEETTERTRFTAPDQVRDMLSKILRERNDVNDEELRQTLYQMCVDIERYFKASSNDKDKDALFFRERLTEVKDILVKYIEIQENTRYYLEPESLLYRGKKSIKDFSTYVLDSIRRGNATNLLEFKVNTNILQAQRFS
jgi:hypothetical protein